MLKTELNGANSSASRSQEGLNGGAPNTVIKGLVIDGFANTDGIGILPDSGTLRNVRIEGNFVGTDPSGTQALGNHPDGVSLFQTSDSTVGATRPISATSSPATSLLASTSKALPSRAARRTTTPCKATS